jgi:hypothetical protein
MECGAKQFLIPRAARAAPFALLVAGDKSGGSEKRFYRRLIEKADERFDAHASKITQRKEWK